MLVDGADLTLFLFTGENVKELFFRMAALSFDRTLSKEQELYRDTPKKVGNDINIR
jgi:hypothetical protein